MAPLGFFDPNDPLGVNALLAKKKPLVATMPAAAPAPVYNPGGPGMDIYNAQTAYNASKRALVNASSPSNPLRAANSASGRALIELTNPSNPYRAASNSASRGLLELSNPANPLRAASNQGKRALIDALGQQSQQQRGYYGTLGGIIGERTDETNRLITATHDTADLTAVAQAQGHRNAANALRDAVGIPRPIEVNTPQGDASALPVGVARTLRSNAEYIGETIKDKEAQRGNQLAALKNALDVGQLDVGDVRRAADLADINLGEATQGASYMDKLAGQNLTEATQGASYLDKLSGQDLQDLLDQLGFERDSAGLDVADAQRAPYGMELYMDPYSGQSSYVTPAEKDALDYEYAQKLGLERIPSQQQLSQARTIYNTQQDAGGSQMAGLSDSALLNQITSFDPTSFQAVRAELIRRLMRKGLTAEQAAVAADDAIAHEMGSRAGRAPAGNNAPTVTVNVP